MDLLERFQLRLTGEENIPDDEVLEDLLESAKNAILSRRYPLQDWPTREVTTTVNGTSVTTQETYVEDRYQDLQLRIALELYGRMGVDGERAHSENGISSTFENGSISESLLAEVKPFVGKW